MSLNTIGNHLCVKSQSFQCPPSLLQIFPSFLQQLTTPNLTKYYGQVGNINNDLIRKGIDLLLRLRNFLDGWDVMSMGRWQGVCEDAEQTSLTLPSIKRLIIALTNDLAGKGLLGMNSNAVWSGFDSRMLLTLARIAGSLSSLWAIFHFWSSWRKFESGSHPSHGGTNRDGSLDYGCLTVGSRLTIIFCYLIHFIQSTRGVV